MNSAETRPVSGSTGGELDTLRTLMVTATQQLLGDTITVSDEDWRGASRLPGWTRGHVATHLARQADALARVVEGSRSGHPQPMYASAEQRDQEIESGATRSGLDLQIDLDTAAGALAELFEVVEQESGWDQVVELRGGDRAPVRLIPLARLAEVVLHHVDLDVGLDMDQVDEETAGWLLEWLAVRLRTRPGFPRVRVTSDTGVSVVVGSEGDVTDVTGPSAKLLGWLTGRSPATGLQGAADLTLPPF